MSFWEELISILGSEAVLTFEKLISKNCKTSKNNASKENHLNCYVKILPADWHICKHYTCGFFFLFFFWGWMEEFSCCSAPETKLEIAKELCTVIRIAYWLLEYNSLHPFFFSHDPFCHLLFLAQEQHDVLKQFLIFLLVSFLHSLLCIKGHRLITLWGIWQTPPSFFFYSSSDIKLVFHSLYRGCLLQISQIRPMVKTG